MAIVPTVRCSRLQDSVRFYTDVLDFSILEDPGDTDPGVCVLDREGDRLILSSHSGDGEYGQAVAVFVDDVDGLFKKFIERGLKPPRDRVSPVHEGPIDQSWGTREFYVDDPDGNILRFTQ